MPILPFERIISGDSSFSKTYVSSVDRATAIAQARSGSGTVAAIVGRVPQWPQLLPYTADNVFSATPPSYVWDSVTATPQTRFFAVSTIGVTLATGQQFLVDLSVFCDDAHDSRIDIFDATDNKLFTTLTPASNLIGGNLDPNCGPTNEAPSNWLNIRHYSNASDAVPVGLNGHTFQIVISFETVNYNIVPLGLPNPAALAFTADIWLIS
ncbi:hypothetical protein PP175_09825 [Aneurinibacillus sp. Ricciae_BoGa-3]|uniref:hypothetical protein n=1 Tax=Aneurinibacillus sp. Ricciae_BoGa-3 TaxID=3022697 RepID=UPI0023426BE0|nr:hypothetical protein [Aneurinibacillus sp. Ricciae_BoGa-3]WCK56179.1 hypothetical protein PP175_09825 [Aneurinibacillus sp. Ricciae_BoGa-3]